MLHVLNHAIKRFLIEVLIDLINYGIHFLFNKNMFSRVKRLKLGNKYCKQEQIKDILNCEVQTENLDNDWYFL